MTSLHGDGEDGETEEEGEGESERERGAGVSRWVGTKTDGYNHREGRGGDKMRERGKKR
jgi:hypothetical protein